MDHYSIKWILMALLLQCFCVAKSWQFGMDYNMSEYWQMPSIHEYESIEGCLRSNPSGVFCVAKSVVKPNVESSIWHSIQKYSRYPYQYQHDLLSRGICVEQCEELVSALNDQQRQEFLQPKFDVNFKYIVNDWLLQNIQYYRQQYGELINICLNYRMQAQYNLTVYSEIEHCTTNDTLYRAIDFWDVLFFVVIAALSLLAMASTIYDAMLSTNEDQNHYRTSPATKTDYLLTSFSLRRNINRLTIKIDGDPIQRDFRFLEATRVLLMTTITWSHVIIGAGFTTMQNPEYVEETASKPEVQIIFSFLFPLQVDVFFAISGLLLAVNLLKYSKNKPFNMGALWMGVVNRYLRSLPVYLLVMLFTVSVYDLLLYSPSGYRVIQMPRTICREKWWINLLYINNYYRPEEQCLIHTWYLAADFQLFIIGFGILMMLWKYPKLLKRTFCAILSIGAILPMINIYLHSTNTTYLLENKSCAFQLWYDKWFTLSYMSTEFHCTSYFAGMLVGVLYHEMQKNDRLLSNSKLFKWLQYIVLPVMIALCLPAPVFHHYDFNTSSLGMLLYAGMYRLAFTALVTVAFLLLMLPEKGSLFGRLRSSKMFENALLRVLSRLSFGFYLVHMSVTKLVFANQHEAERLSVFLGLVVFFSVTFMSYLLALLAYLFVEKPFDVIIKQLLERGPRRVKPENPSNNNLLNNASIMVECNGNTKNISV